MSARIEDLDLAAGQRIDLSVVTTAHNEAGNVEGFLSGSLAAFQELGITGEILYFDDGSTDGTRDAVAAFARLHPDANINLIWHRQRRGISAALRESVGLCRGHWACFLPADLESLPETDISILWHAASDDIDIVVGQRVERGDRKAFASRIFNFLNWVFFGLKLRDANWIKLVRREKLTGFPPGADWHRFFVPILFVLGCRIRAVDTKWHSRTYGSSKFGLRRFPVSIVDMVTVRIWLWFNGRKMLFAICCAVFDLMLGLAALAVGALVSDNISIASWTVFGACLASGIVIFQTALLAELLSCGLDDEPRER
jgi:glycosyltransferase involved in cell wall biosynthesis